MWHCRASLLVAEHLYFLQVMQLPFPSDLSSVTRASGLRRRLEPLRQLPQRRTRSRRSQLSKGSNRPACRPSLIDTLLISLVVFIPQYERRTIKIFVPLWANDIRLKANGSVQDERVIRLDLELV